MDALSALRRRLAEIADLQGAIATLAWDQETYMPPGGAEARGRQLALLGRMAHEQFTDPQVGRWLEQIEASGDARAAGSLEHDLLRVVRRDYQQAMRLPAEFVATMMEHSSAAYDRWTRARPANAFAMVADSLERTLELSHQYAGYTPGLAHPADAMIDGSDEGMTVAQIRPLFAELRAGLVPLIEAVGACPAPDAAFLTRHYPAGAQLATGMACAVAFGYDPQRGRQDLTHHPFATRISGGDVRITTRVREDDFSEAFFSTLHEAGHAMYEQGVMAELEGTPLASGTSAGVHESQSRLWENIVGRSRGFAEYIVPRLREAFPQQFADVTPDGFYRAVNRVSRSLIRTDADEVTYNLHVIIRFELELELLEGRLAVRDLPEAWRERYRRDLGVVPPDDRDGVLQDVHWFAGLVGGAFQGYTLGNIMSAQFYQAACAAHPDIPAAITRGEFATLHGWLQRMVYAHGRRLDADAVVRHATGSSLTIAPYLAYLDTKYRALYQC